MTGSSDNEPPAGNFIQFNWKTLRRFWKKQVPAGWAAGLILMALFPTVFRYLHPQKKLTTMMSPTGPEALGIQELVREVKSELVATELEMKKHGEASLFDLKDFELELNFVIHASSSEKAGVRTELVTADSEFETGSEKIQKLTLHWNAATPAPFEGASRDAKAIDSADVIVSKTPLKKAEQP